MRRFVMAVGARRETVRAGNAVRPMRWRIMRPRAHGEGVKGAPNSPGSPRRWADKVPPSLFTKGDAPPSRFHAFRTIWHPGSRFPGYPLPARLCEYGGPGPVLVING